MDCVLCIDEMSIKTHLYYNLSKDYIVGFNNFYDQKSYQPAKHVLCFILRGLNYNWKQPIAYYFIRNTCTNFFSFDSKMNVPPERPYFFVNQQKIFYVFDAPHLLKSTRNNFFKYNLKFLNCITDKKFLDNFYTCDQSLYLLAPKLTDAHINPGPFQKMRVQYASQVFCGTVASGMRCCVEGGILPLDSQFTIQFIEDMDKLFDILNSKPIVICKEFNQPYKNTLSQRGHLLYMLRWQITINSLFQLWDDIKKPEFSLSTYRLNQDCMENLSGNFCNQCVLKSGHTDLPTLKWWTDSNHLPILTM
ncbi:uncharacterized protein LOC126893526 [Daktulosphaira vitifoliae]|uniref:uncharacterized protein LOC126893526 n=1 Tax=Daktulosphaira vitifoliae TaxID=58002 RepID=UPI0021AA9F33|nr:uncharacterized protein LOC126893526 [Daktulosphaira vitifoliae]